MCRRRSISFYFHNPILPQCILYHYQLIRDIYYLLSIIINLHHKYGNLELKPVLNYLFKILKLMQNPCISIPFRQSDFFHFYPKVIHPQYLLKELIFILFPISNIQLLNNLKKYMHTIPKIYTKLYYHDLHYYIQLKLNFQYHIHLLVIILL